MGLKRGHKQIHTASAKLGHVDSRRRHRDGSDRGARECGTGSARVGAGGREDGAAKGGWWWATNSPARTVRTDSSGIRTTETCCLALARIREPGHTHHGSLGPSAGRPLSRPATELRQGSHPIPFTTSSPLPQLKAQEAQFMFEIGGTDPDLPCPTSHPPARPTRNNKRLYDRASWAGISLAHGTWHARAIVH